MDETKSVLVVEDEIIVSMEIQHYLRSLGYNISDAVTTGREAIERAIENHPDLILMDITLKGKMDGIEAANQIRQTLNIPVIYLTAHSDMKTLQRVKDTGSFGMLQKPFEERYLHTAVEMALYRHGIETKLKSIERLFVATLGSITDAVIVTDNVGSILFMNGVAGALIGWNIQVAQSRELKEVFRIANGELLSHPDNSIESAMKGEIVFDSADPARLIDKDGTERFIEGRATPVHDDEKNTIGLVLVFRAKQALQRSTAA